MRSRFLVVSFSLVVPGLVAILSGVPQVSAAETCDLTVVRVYFTERATVEAIAAWTEPWEVRRDLGYLVVGVNPEGFIRLAAAGYDLEIDEKLTEQYCTPVQALPDQVDGIPGYPCYRTVEETYQAAQDLVTAHPDLASVIDVGDSWEKVTAGGLPGYDLLVLKLTNSNVAGTPTGTEPPHGKPKFLITAAIHAREYTTAELALRFAEELVSGHGTDPDATWLLDEHEIHILLHANPDGRKHAEAGISWRKNTNENYCGPTDPYRGADLNRNFEYQWGCCGGSSGSPCDITYRGPSPFSEPETQSVRNYARAIFPDQKGPDPTDPAPATATGLYLDLHSYSELVLWAWGFTSTVAPNGPALQTLGRRLAYFNGYEPDQAIGLYPTDGTTVDFAYGDLGVAAVLFELGTNFFQSCSTFESTILPDNLESLRYFAKVARTPYLTPGGPSVTSVVSPAGTVIVAPGEPVEARAVVDDLPFNNSNGTEPTQNITAAEVYLDAPPWQVGATPLAMSAADGSFDSTTETVVTSVATTGLADGRHTLFFRGQDASGQWGPVSAAFFWVQDPSQTPHIAGTVTEQGTGLPLAATVTVGTTSTATNPADGSYDIMVLVGTYTVTAAAPDHASSAQNGVVAVSGTTTTVDFQLRPLMTLLWDDVEGGNIGWTVQSTIPGGTNWSIVTDGGSNHAWFSSDHNSVKDDRLIAGPFSLNEGTTLSFDHHWQFEGSSTMWDGGVLEVSTNGTTWQDVLAAGASFIEGGYTGTLSSSGSNPLSGRQAWTADSPGTVHTAVDLSALTGQDLWFRYRLGCDGSVGDVGWYVDNILLQTATDGEPPMFYDGFESGTTDSWSSVVP